MASRHTVIQFTPQITPQRSELNPSHVTRHPSSAALACPQTRSRNVLTSCVRLTHTHVSADHLLNLLRVDGRSGGGMWECDFWEFVVCSLSPSLWRSKRCRTPACTLCRGGLMGGGHSRLGVKLQAMESVERTRAGQGSLSLHHSRTQQRQNL